MYEVKPAIAKKLDVAELTDEQRYGQLIAEKLDNIKRAQEIEKEIERLHKKLYG